MVEIEVKADAAQEDEARNQVAQLLDDISHTHADSKRDQENEEQKVVTSTPNERINTATPDDRDQPQNDDINAPEEEEKGVEEPSIDSAHKVVVLGQRASLDKVDAPSIVN